MLNAAYKWITRRGYFLTFVLIILWPVLSIPARVFSKSYFAFWVILSLMWGFTATAVITFLPITESSTAIMKVCNGVWNMIFPCCKISDVVEEPEEVPAKEEPEIFSGEKEVEVPVDN
jgi:hypothetical protein